VKWKAGFISSNKEKNICQFYQKSDKLENIEEKTIQIIDNLPIKSFSKIKKYGVLSFIKLNTLFNINNNLLHAHIEKIRKNHLILRNL
jgi:hypothetical protein